MKIKILFENIWNKKTTKIQIKNKDKLKYLNGFFFSVLIVPKKRNSKVEFHWNIFEKMESGKSYL